MPSTYIQVAGLPGHAARANGVYSAGDPRFHRRHNGRQLFAQMNGAHHLEHDGEVWEILVSADPSLCWAYVRSDAEMPHLAHSRWQAFDGGTWIGVLVYVTIIDIEVVTSRNRARSQPTWQRVQARLPEVLNMPNNLSTVDPAVIHTKVRTLGWVHAAKRKFIYHSEAATIRIAQEEALREYQENAEFKNVVDTCVELARITIQASLADSLFVRRAQILGGIDSRSDAIHQHDRVRQPCVRLIETDCTEIGFHRVQEASPRGDKDARLRLLQDRGIQHRKG
jgi:hypothetical protein